VLHILEDTDRCHVSVNLILGAEPGEYRDLSYHSQRIHSLDNGSLIISKAAQELEGYYLCQAGNGIGPGLSKVILLTVHGESMIHFVNDIKHVKMPQLSTNNVF